MSERRADEPKIDEVAFWNGPGGRHWVNRQEAWDAVLAPVSAATIARAVVRPGERIVDVGCGCGATTIELARLVGSAGKVLGLDVSRPMLARAIERLPPGLPVEFVLGDATTHPLAQGGFDLLFSRFGVMFFHAPARAFANLRSALRPGGRLVFACFRTSKENPWMMVPLHAAYEHVPALPKLGPEDPGAFSFASQDRVRRILGDAGFAAIDFAPFDLALDIGGGRGLEEAVTSALEVGAASRAIDGQPPAVRDAVAASIRRVFAGLQRGTTVSLAAGIWLVSAARG